MATPFKNVIRQSPNQNIVIGNKQHHNLQFLCAVCCPYIVNRWFLDHYNNVLL